MDEDAVSDRSNSYTKAMRVAPDTRVLVVAPASPTAEGAPDGLANAAIPIVCAGPGGVERESRVDTEGPSMTFEDIRFEVSLKKTGQRKVILDNLSGIFPASSMTFIMGPSGAGKTTLLDALADRMHGGDLTGTTKVNGQSLKPWQFRAVSGYVQQEDVLVPVLTAEETLFYAALFYTTDSAEARSRAAESLRILGLEKSAGTWVGNALIRGLSGGQKRRLSVGIELVAKPRILFLDEPTSGLDSTSAAAVVEALRRITRVEGTTMALTIHQPAEMLMRMSDRVIVLSGGRTAYAGPSADAVQHMASLGHSIPPHTSTSEFLLDLVNADFSDAPTVEKILTAWTKSPQAVANADMIQNANGGGAAASRAGGNVVPTTQYATPFWHEFVVLTRRGFLNTLRNPLVIWLRMALYVTLSIMIGTVWLRIGAGTPKSNVVQDIANVLFFIAAFMVFMSVAVQIAFIEEMALFRKERAAGMYSTFAHALSHVVVDAPFLLLLAVVCSAICYWCIGLNDTPGRFSFFILDLFLSFMVAESLMVVVAAVVPVAIVGIAAGAMIYGAFMLVQGFFIKLDQIGWWWRWMHFIGLHSYSFSAFMVNEFEGTNFPQGDSNGVVIPAITGEEVLQSYDFNNTDKWENMAVLFAMVVIYRLIAAYIMSR
mmetsp:Transcript_2757/g.6592  ORF Transcript_2757/g.6592 Transcript_2757/m.6592 type:complete len:656 (-) Transcript_2757:287-2254(-)